MNPRTFRDRREAGQLLASKLAAYANRPDVIVSALPRGGVPVGHEVAQALNVPLDVFVVRKIGVPGHEELAMGAVASSGVRILNEALIKQLRIGADRGNDHDKSLDQQSINHAHVGPAFGLQSTIGSNVCCSDPGPRRPSRRLDPINHRCRDGGRFRWSELVGWRSGARPRNRCQIHEVAHARSARPASDTIADTSTYRPRASVKRST